jgi:cholesterol transport system auxiliary component
MILKRFAYTVLSTYRSVHKASQQMKAIQRFNPLNFAPLKNGLRHVVWASCILLVGCGVGQPGPAMNQLDLGPLPLDTQTQNLAPNPRLALAIPSGLSTGFVQTTAVVWRLGAQGVPQTYATFTWVTPPAALMRQRLIDRLSRQGPVLPSVLDDKTPVLSMNLQQFEQVFQSNGQNEAVLTLQVVLTRGSTVLGSDVIYERVPALSADAVAGAQALNVASNRAAERVAIWVNKMLLTRAK